MRSTSTGTRHIGLFTVITVHRTIFNHTHLKMIFTHDLNSYNTPFLKMLYFVYIEIHPCRTQVENASGSVYTKDTFRLYTAVFTTYRSFKKSITCPIVSYSCDQIYIYSMFLFIPLVLYTHHFQKLHPLNTMHWTRASKKNKRHTHI
jgi:hypothetical protein